jgi:hypothetical protein
MDKHILCHPAIFVKNVTYKNEGCIYLNHFGGRNDFEFELTYILLRVMGLYTRYRLTLATAKSIAGLLPCLFEALVLLKY